MMSSKLDYIAMEVRSALNYQTETLATNLDQLVQVSSDCFEEY